MREPDSQANDDDPDFGKLAEIMKIAEEWQNIR